MGQKCQCLSLYGATDAGSFANNCFSVGMCSMRGLKMTMEDRHSICLSLRKHPYYSLFAIFDGFNGDGASQYLSKHLVKTLNDLHSLDDDQLIIDTINKMDQNFLKTPLYLVLNGAIQIFA